MNREDTIKSLLSGADVDEELDDEQEHDAIYAKPRPAKDPSQVYSVRLPVSLIATLRRLAAAEDTTPSDLVRRYVIQAIEHNAALPDDDDERLRYLFENTRSQLDAINKLLADRGIS